MSAPSYRISGRLSGTFAALPACAFLLAGCATYREAPLAPAKSEKEWRARSLSDAGLLAFLRQRGLPDAHSWPPAALDMADLDGIALFYNSEIALARAQLATAQAGKQTAGERPNPVASIVPEYIPNPDAGLAPWALAFSLDIPIETAGKRSRRIEQAAWMADAARWALAESVWKTRSQIRGALVEYLLARRQIDLLKSETGLRESVLRILERRLELGEGSRFEVNLAQNELFQSKLAAIQAEGQVRQSFVALAGVLGVPPSSLELYALEWPGLDDPSNLGGMVATAAHADGLLNRLDVRRALSEYAAVDAGLRLELAKQYPDIHLTPGYMFDQGEHRFSLGPSMELPIFNQHKGPIAEAEARRKQSAANFLATQAQAISQTEQAREAFLQSLRELDQIGSSLGELQRKTENITRRAVELGETDRLALETARLQGATLARSRLEALRKVQSALGQLEDAVQRPLVGPETVRLAPGTFLPDLKGKKP